MQSKELLEKRAEKARVTLGLSKDDMTLIVGSAWAVYEDVSYDLEPDNKRKGLCRRSTVLEVVTDAGRLELEVRRRAGLSTSFSYGQADRHNDHPLVKACRSNLITDLIGAAFSTEWYEAGRENAAAW